ncbi:hypothetical protein [Deminuibacter soli]|uniref:Uncharacterized protein n=1 Tax=Deminuibacter soli TaxID=2291815 RepID=A0A3E1NLK9_9BACT|nr:hypothetical protein [Deminuibacter soli]RFM28678.1 hypothetical protein DXN05_07755 [Deminuibacter soli]
MFAQDCKDFYFLQANKTVEITICNKKNEETGKNVYTVSDVSGSNFTTVNVQSEVFNKGKV